MTYLTGIVGGTGSDGRGEEEVWTGGMNTGCSPS